MGVVRGFYKDYNEIHLLKGTTMNLLPNRTSPIDQVIEKHIAQMRLTMPNTKEYAEMAETLETLIRAKSLETPRSVSPDTALTVGANLLGMGMIMNFERLNVITTKAFGLLLKAKI